jgi:hypothetical protein
MDGTMATWDFTSAIPDSALEARQAAALAAIQTDRPSAARMYDYLLGGKDNFEVDRQAVAQIAKTVGPSISVDVPRENRRFLQRGIRWLAEQGVDQFLDIGTGLPTAGNVHEIAQSVNPNAHVVYVDNDPIILAHGRALFADDRSTTVIAADAREPETITTNPEVCAMLDFSRPIAVIMCAVLHFIPDGDDPVGIVTTLMKAVPAGSYLLISHFTSDGAPSDGIGASRDAMKNATSQFIFRSRAEIEGLFVGLPFVEPGLVRPHEWHPADDDSPRTDWLLGGVARKD